MKAIKTSVTYEVTQEVSHLADDITVEVVVSIEGKDKYLTIKSDHPSENFGFRDSDPRTVEAIAKILLKAKELADETE